MRVVCVGACVRVPRACLVCMCVWECVVVRVVILHVDARVCLYGIEYAPIGTTRYMFVLVLVRRSFSLGGRRSPPYAVGHPGEVDGRSVPVHSKVRGTADAH